MRAKTEIIKLTKLKVRPTALFGEYLVQQHVLDRFQLFRALQLQDRLPRVKLGVCAVALGYAPRDAIEALYSQYCHNPCPPDLESMITEAFHREPEIEIVYTDDLRASR